MTPIQIMALIVALIGAIKTILVLISPKTWADKIVKPIYANPFVTSIAALILGGVSLWYLLKELTIIQIFASMLFFMALMLLGFAAFSKDTVAFAQKLLKDQECIKKCWLVLIIWIVLLIWVFYALFA